MPAKNRVKALNLGITEDLREAADAHTGVSQKLARHFESAPR
jgi:hypothetical protein